jgi:trehalose-6-phosphatase
MAELSLDEASLSDQRAKAQIVGPAHVVEKIIASGREIACFLDFDGTLVDIVERYDEVVVPDEMPSLLGRLSEAQRGAVAILSGRSIADLDRFLSPLVLPGCGQHGLELRVIGERATAAGSALVLDGIRDAFCELPQRMSGIRLEDKGLTLALHYRERPEAEAELMALAEGHRDRPLRRDQGPRARRAHAPEALHRAHAGRVRRRSHGRIRLPRRA